MNVAVSVNIVESVLLQEELTNHTSDFERQLLVNGQCVGTDQLDDFLQFGLDLEQTADLRSDFREILGDVVSEPLVQTLQVSEYEFNQLMAGSDVVEPNRRQTPRTPSRYGGYLGTQAQRCLHRAATQPR